MEIVAERTVQHPIEAVFDLIADQARTTQWCLALTELALLGPIAKAKGTKDMAKDLAALEGLLDAG